MGSRRLRCWISPLGLRPLFAIQHHSATNRYFSVNYCRLLLQFATSLLSYITTNHNTRITMKDLSKKFNCSVSTLSHIFKKRSGVSISEYIENLRLDEARWLLKQTSYTVTEISDSLGFCNVFKKKFGVSPRRYNAMFS